MKSAKTIINKPVVFIVASVIAGLLITLIIVFLLIIPKFAAYMSYKSQNSDLNANVEKLDESIKVLSSLNEEEISRLSLVMSSFLPKTDDTLNFLTLNEVLASSAGVGISSVSLGAEKASKVGVGKETTQATTAPSQDQNSAQTTQAAQIPIQQNQGSEGSFIVRVAAKGFFSNLIRFVLNYQMTNRLVGLNEVTIAGKENVLTVTLTAELPLGASSVKASSEDNLVLTQEEKDTIKFIEDGFIFSASPSKDPLGRPNPFR